MSEKKSYDKIVWSSCNVNCGSRCPLRLFIKDGKVAYIEPDHIGEETSGSHEIRACLRGRGMRQWIHSKDRLLHPLKRTGKRGAGQFERILWDQALDTIASELGRIIDQYGFAQLAIYLNISLTL